jgi:hypothetical protein
MKNGKINSMLKRVFVVVLCLTIPLTIFAQEETESSAPVTKDKKPVRSPWSASTLIESQSYMVFPKNTLVFTIQHRFGKLNSNTFDLFGLYAPSNIRMGFSYTVFNNFQLGIGTTKNNKLQDLNWKYNILEQTRSNSMPVALTYFGNVEYDARDAENFGENYKGSNRLSYFNQLIIGRTISDKLTMQIMANYAHFNQIDTVGVKDFEHSNMGVGVAARYKFSPQSSIVVEYEHPLTTPEPVKPNLSIALEVATSSHAFQIFITTYDNISYQRNLTYNTNDFNKGDFLIGFNITRNWNF